MPTYRQTQRLNTWVSMLHELYGSSQNYGKGPYEIHVHLTEVTGIFAKYLFKLNDPTRARDFLPKIFAWAVALLKKVQPGQDDLEEILLRKFPTVCPYCGTKPCSCWDKTKPTLDDTRVRDLYFQRAGAQSRTLNDYQFMFRSIYEPSWFPQDAPDPTIPLRCLYTRMVEELAEVAESLRFFHLYPDNFENELADFFAWWFALTSCLHHSLKTPDVILAEDLLWRAYPGICKDCNLTPCFCRPGPVRELMSRPPPGQNHRVDRLTLLNNQGAYLEDLEAIATGTTLPTPPIACMRADIDAFKHINDTYGHPAGDAALRHVAAIIRKKVRERDSVYRPGGDEFAAIFTDFSEDEAAGVMTRVCRELSTTPVRWVSPTGSVNDFFISLSVGVSECTAASDIKQGFDLADRASYYSKKHGKARVTKHSEVKPEPEGS